MGRDKFVAVAAVRTRNPLALQAQHGAGVRPFRHRHGHRAGGRRYLHLAAEHVLAQRDRQIDVDVVALACEDMMRTNFDLDQGVTWRFGCDFFANRR
jgi:hypothetical protein